MKILSLFIISFLLSAGCQKETRNKRCVYDREEFAVLCQRAVAEEEVFRTFKSDPFYRLLYQDDSYEEGLRAIKHIEQHAPHVLENLDRFRTSDLIGAPRLCNYGAYGMFSVATLHYLQIASDIEREMGAFSSGDVIQIGANGGALCKALWELAQWKSYTIVDLPEHLALARKVLEREGITSVQFVTPEELRPAKCDLVVSDLCFSEFSRPLQELFIERIFKEARAGYLNCHVVPKHFGVVPMLPNELNKCLQTKLPQFELKGENHNYCLLWKQRS